MKAHAYFFPKWPYDEALVWMQEAKESIKNGDQHAIIGCGSHKEKIITFGRNYEINDFSNNLKENNYIIRKIDRGGGITAHEFGQLVLYPVFNIQQLKLTIPKLVALMETAMIDFLRDVGISANRSAVSPGVFIDGKKVGFIGLRVSEGITYHGLSLNLLNDAKIFSHFDPCGIKGLPVTRAEEHVKLMRPLIEYIKMLAGHFLRLLQAPS